MVKWHVRDKLDIQIKVPCNECVVDCKFNLQEMALWISISLM